MNNLLQKCVEELKAEKPDLSYIRGILETLIETNLPKESSVATALSSFPRIGAMNTPTSLNELKQLDDASLLDAQAKAMIAHIQPQPQEI